ncbi:sigma-70 family RNA polymerase sigma factor [Achromobacter pestifer]|uniref:Putative RNA polymerase sigma factor FecI n=1 Tax=Achromobacter pestifer TaxID=1353889 RepID=A0A6S6Z064_9BURK|nr:sigma-70 family RNA polymerase sigma factor [Achromobacter pestifer]CAB3653942.1 putative RNA polymerase sigma factor FecI [Achromobacter pestifer]
MRKISDLYAGHHSWLKGWLRKRMGDSDTAADLAQDTFVRVLSKPPEGDLAEPRAYLTVIAKGLVSNWYRRRAIENAYLEELASRPEAYSVSPEERALMLEALFEIDAMLEKLPAKAREAFLLSQLEELPYSEIAQRLNISLSTVKRYIVLGFAQCLATMA